MGLVSGWVRDGKGWGSGVGTCLDNIHPDILNNGVDLFPQKLGRHQMDAVDPLCVLRCEGRRGRHGIAAMGRDDLLVCLEAAVNRWCKSSHTLTQTANLARQLRVTREENIRSARAVGAGNYKHPSRSHLKIMLSHATTATERQC